MNHLSIKPHSYHTLDAWRAVASLWVVMFHMSLVLLVSYPQLSVNPLYIFSLSGGLGVQMFFVISGYCIANAVCKAHLRNQSFGTFMRARVRRIFPPYLYALVLSGALSLLASWLVSSHRLRSSVMAEHNPLHQSGLYYFSNLTLTQGIFDQPFLLAQAWTLCYEMAFYIIVGLMLIVAYLSKGKFLLLTMLHSITCTLLTLLIAFPQYVKYPLDLWPQFGLGIMAYDVLSHPGHLKPKLWIAVTTMLVVVFAITHQGNIGLMGEQARPSFLFCLVFTGLIVLLHKYDEMLYITLPVKLLSSLGLISYSLYLTHTFSIGLINQAVKALHLSVNYQVPVFVLFLILSVGFARLFFQFCERPFIGTAKKQTFPPLLVSEGVPAKQVP